MKRAISLILCLCLLLCGCGAGQVDAEPTTTDVSGVSVTSQNVIMTISFEYGERTGPYIGDTDENGLPHGYGTFSSEKPDGTGWTYTGEWDHGHWNSRGCTVWSTGESYSGYYANDEMNGYGVYTSPDGTVISGNFVNRVPTGHCAVYLSGDYDGYIFWGNFVGANAEGLIYTPTGDSFPATYSIGQENPTTGTTKITSEESVPTTNITAGMRNALRAAENYLSIMPFSYSGLIKQLEYESYTHEEAVYAADNCGADWNEQAAKAAKNYLDLMPFSRHSLIDQLKYDGYTITQATYGADQNGL